MRTFNTAFLIVAIAALLLCICGATTVQNQPPAQPRNPNPPNGATNVPTTPILSWFCVDPDGDRLMYNIYFGTNLTPPLVASNISSNSYNPGTLQYNTKYYWKVVAKDDKGGITEGPIWSFTTAREVTVSLEWQKCLGGSKGEFGFSIQQTIDGGYIIAGSTNSDDGDVSGYRGYYDIWVVKLDVSGNLQWQKCLGGSNDDHGFNIQQTIDGGYIVVGETRSNDRDVLGNHGECDVWVVKLNKRGELEWQRCLGGSSYDGGKSIRQTTDGGYIMAGYTSSNDGDVTGNHGDEDAWVVKLDRNGNIQWQKCLGGSSKDGANDVEQTTDGGYIVIGYTRSNDGDVRENHGKSDVWVVKLDQTGNIQWQRCLGGSEDDGGGSIQQTTDGGYIVAALTESNDGDVNGNHGSSDGWIVKLDQNGNIQWRKCLGGSDEDLTTSIQQTSDGGYVVVGYTYSNDGDVSGKYGESDVWVVKLDSSGNVQWQRCLGGSSYDVGSSIQQTIDGGYIIVGITGSNDGNVNGNHESPGGRVTADVWVVKLELH